MFLQDNVTIFVIIINKNEGIRWKIESNFQLVLIYRLCYNWFYIGPVIKAGMYVVRIIEDFGYLTPVRLLIIFPLYQVLLV
jgi:hypothetical protein